MRSFSLLRAGWNGVALLGLSLAAHASLPDGSLTVEVTPDDDVLTPGTPAVITATGGGAGDFLLFLVDTEAADSQLPFLGGIDIGLAQTEMFNTLFRVMDGDGTAAIACSVNCDDVAFFGVKLYVQAASFNRMTREVCVSNVDCVTWDDEAGTACGQGCTPGYWRQGHHYDDWAMPYQPSDLFVDVFGIDAFPGLTLGDVVQLGGGGLNALGRHTVAALLNAASADVGYPIDDALDVVLAFQNVYGTPGEWEAQKDAFEHDNELGCPL